MHEAVAFASNDVELSGSLFDDPASVDSTKLQTYLLEHQNLYSEGTVDASTKWIKGVFFYDYLMNKQPVAERWNAKSTAARGRRKDKSPTKTMRRRG